MPIYLLEVSLNGLVPIHVELIESLTYLNNLVLSGPLENIPIPVPVVIVIVLTVN